MNQPTATKFYTEIFKTSGASYHAAMRLCPTARDGEFQAAVKYLGPASGDVVLDVPAGGGYLKEYLPKGVDYFAFDFAGGFHSSVEQSSIVRRCSESTIPLANRSVDRVLCLAAMHHMEDRTAFYRECERILKTDGRVVIADVIEDSPQGDFLNGFVDRWNARGHRGAFLNPLRDDSEATAGGFSISRSTEAYVWCFPSKERALQYCRLLFCLDEDPSDAELEEALNTLGFRSDDSGSYFDWKLEFLTLKKHCDSFAPTPK